MSWLKWQARLRGEKVMTYPQPDEEDEGFYRTLLTEPDVNAKTGLRNGKTKVLAWGKPVAYFMADGKLCGAIGDRDMTENEVNDLWTYVCRYPISEELYRDCAEKGLAWPELPPKAVAEIPAADRDVTATDNAPAEAIPLVKAHAIAIKTAVDAAIKKVASNEDAATALGTKNRIAELRLAADKAGKARYQPPYEEYKRIYDEWSPIIKLAESEEKRLNKEILTFRESERLRIAAEQAEADRKQLEIDEANARAADRAIARGEPEQPPEVIEIEPVAVAAPIVATYGSRGVKEQMKTFLDEVDDFDLVYNFFKIQSRGQVETFLRDLAERAIKAGFEVPGTKTRKGLI